MLHQSQEIQVDRESNRINNNYKKRLVKVTSNLFLGNLAWKIHCASATSKNSEELDPQVQIEKVNMYMAKKADEAIKKKKFNLSSYEGIDDYCLYLRGHLSVVDVRLQTSSIKITVRCRTLAILEYLWGDYRSGNLNAVAEECLITEEVKDELDMETIQLTTTILEEDYLACKSSLMAGKF